MRILVLGAGRIGKAIIHDLSDEFEICAVDINEKNLRDVKNIAETKKVDVRNETKMRETMKHFELVIDSLPGKFGFSILNIAIKMKKNLVDVSFMRENPLKFKDEVKNSTIVVDAGFAPGLSNIILGNLYHTLGEFDEAIIRVGGLPKNPKPPLYYSSTWSPEDLIEEYMRKARIIKDGEIIEVEPLSNIREVKINNFEFEEFPSDGLRTLLYTIKAKNLEERTLRWKGHLEKIKILKELGFFNPENVEHTLKVLSPHLKDGKDFCIMEIYARKGNEERRYWMYDEAKEFSSMARVTGFTAAIIARLIINEKLEYGILPPEYIGMNDNNFRYVINEIRKREIELKIFT